MDSSHGLHVWAPGLVNLLGPLERGLDTAYVPWESFSQDPCLLLSLSVALWELLSLNLTCNTFLCSRKQWKVLDFYLSALQLGKLELQVYAVVWLVCSPSAMYPVSPQAPTAQTLGTIGLALYA